MRVLYIAKHGNGFADDEGAIAHALTALGHEVRCLPEADAGLAANLGLTPLHPLDADLVLFHKLDPVGPLATIRVPKVCWYFDRVEDDDPHPRIQRRWAARREWMARITPLADLVLCTDGDWVAKDQTGKLAVLRQGADERIVGAGTPWPEKYPPILMTGIEWGGGLHRSQFVAWMRRTYGERFNLVTGGVWRENLRDLVASSAVVVAPDAPGSDKYWSVRVYQALGFGAFLLHPFWRELGSEYPGDHTIKYYHDREHLKELIDLYAAPDKAGHRRAVGGNAIRHTLTHHTYRHRCRRMLEIVKQRLGITG